MSEDKEFNFACFFGFHDWNKWKQIEAYSITNTITKEPMGTKYVYERVCADCGKIEHKVETVYLK